MKNKELTYGIIISLALHIILIGFLLFPKFILRKAKKPKPRTVAVNLYQATKPVKKPPQKKKPQVQKSKPKKEEKKKPEKIQKPKKQKTQKQKKQPAKRRKPVAKKPTKTVKKTTPPITKKPSVPKQTPAPVIKKTKTTEPLEAKVDFPYTNYLNAVRSLFDDAWDIPEEHFLAQGTLECTVSFTILRNGRIAQIKLTKSSRNKKFDKLAIETTTDIDQLPPLPAGYRRNTLDVDFHFKFDPLQKM